MKILSAQYISTPKNIDGSSSFEGQLIISYNEDGTVTTHRYPGSPEIERWLEEGNTPLPPDPIPEPEPLTPQQKLEAAGLTVEELKELLGLS